MSDIKSYFVSRWGDDGVIMNADFSQLEVIVLAHLSNDVQLAEDILNGLDMHRVRAAQLFGKPEAEVTKEERTIAKAFSFQLQYGSGAKNMAETNGVPVELAKDFIRQYYERYYMVKSWQDDTMIEVEKKAKLIPEHSYSGYPLKESYLQVETGRRYRFKQGDAPSFMQRDGVFTSFKPTEVKNYPVQGTATGDIVPMMLGKVWRWLVTSKYKDDALLINTVHDSIMLDVKKSVAEPVGIHVKKIMESAPQEYRNRFGVYFNLPLKVEVTYGPNWAEEIGEIA